MLYRQNLVVVLYFISCCVLDAVSFEKRRAGRADYSFHFFVELSQVVYGLLSRSRNSTSLPPLNSRDDYMDSSKAADLEKKSSDDFLVNYDFGSTWRSFKGGKSREFRRQCPDFIDRFVDVILAQCHASSDFTRYIYCFCPEFLLEGRDEIIFGLFNDLFALLRQCKVVSDVEASAATEEFLSFVVDVRVRTAMTCSESGDSSVASASAVIQGSSGTSSGRRSKVKKYSSLASLFGRKRSVKETVDSGTKKSKKESAKSVGKSGASSWKNY